MKRGVAALVSDCELGAGAIDKKQHEKMDIRVGRGFRRLPVSSVCLSVQSEQRQRKVRHGNF